MLLFGGRVGEGVWVYETLQTFYGKGVVKNQLLFAFLSELGSLPGRCSDVGMQKSGATTRHGRRLIPGHSHPQVWGRAPVQYRPLCS